MSINIAIVGTGARGINILERIIAIYPDSGFNEKFTINLIESRQNIGAGCHDINQPDYLLVNTVACQITMFGDKTLKHIGPIIEGPSFYEWALLVNYRYIDGEYIKSTDQSGRPINPNDYLPRKLLGEYLNWTYDYISQIAHPNITINILNDELIDVEPITSNSTYCLHFKKKESIIVRFIYLTVGHGKNFLSVDEHIKNQFVTNLKKKNNRLNFFPKPYPISGISNISSNSKVAIQGMGLTSYDILAHLTKGLGGKFIIKGNRAEYIPSGMEPKIYLYSRQGLPFSGRAANEKGTSGQYQPVFFTEKNLQEIKKNLKKKDNAFKLDFEKHLLPLMIKEMAYVYRSTANDNWEDPITYIMSEEDKDIIHSILYPNHGKSFKNIKEYRIWVNEFLENDIIEAEKGNITGPIKAATDVLRDTRDILRNTVEYSELSEDSYKKLLSHYCPIINRISVGPPHERNIQLQALLNKGIVSIACGPNPTLSLNYNEGCFEITSTFTGGTYTTKADVLIQAKIDSFSPFTDNSLLVTNLKLRGLIRPYLNEKYHSGGVDVDRSCNLIGINGFAIRQLWSIGNFIEGPHFYTYILPRPFVGSRALKDAGLIVLDMYAQLSGS